jgi:hypothetical protein
MSHIDTCLLQAYGKDDMVLGKFVEAMELLQIWLPFPISNIPCFTYKCHIDLVYFQPMLITQCSSMLHLINMALVLIFNKM